MFSNRNIEDSLKDIELKVDSIFKYMTTLKQYMEAQIDLLETKIKKLNEK